MGFVPLLEMISIGNTLSQLCLYELDPQSIKSSNHSMHSVCQHVTEIFCAGHETPVGTAFCRPRIESMIKFTITSGDHKGRPYDGLVWIIASLRRRAGACSRHETPIREAYSPVSHGKPRGADSPRPNSLQIQQHPYQPAN